MSKTATALDITMQVAKYAPIAISLILAAEQSTANGATKKTAVMAAILSGAAAGMQSNDPQIQGISALVDNIVTVFNMTGVFTKPAATDATK